jgi:hypothetical protein
MENYILINPKRYSARYLSKLREQKQRELDEYRKSHQEVIEAFLDKVQELSTITSVMSRQIIKELKEEKVLIQEEQQSLSYLFVQQPAL